MYEKKASNKALYLREERDGGKPRSFKKLDLFLEERRVEIGDFLTATTETAYPGADPVGEAGEEEAGEDSDLEEGSGGELGDTSDEDLLDDQE